MNLSNTIRLMQFGGPGSGCHGDNCGRPKGAQTWNLPAGNSLVQALKTPVPQSWQNEMADVHWKQRAFGGIIVNNRGQFLLREPSGHFGGYAWTFPKGKLDDKTEHPAEAAMREVMEETGTIGKIFDHLPGTFKSDSGSPAAFYFMRQGDNIPDLMDEETRQIKWVNYDEARTLIEQSPNTFGRKRDLIILEEAQRHLDDVYMPKKK